MNLITLGRDRTKLTRAYKRLDVDDRKLLRLISVIYSPITLSNFTDFVRNTGLKDKGGAALSDRLDSNWRDDLVRKKLLINLSSRLNCPPSLCEMLTREEVSSKTFAASAKFLDEFLNASKLLNPSTYTISYEDALRDFRLLLYSKAPATALFDQLNIALEAYYRLPQKQLDPLLLVLANPLDKKWLLNLPRDSAFRMLSNCINGHADQLRSHKEAMALLEKPGKIPLPKEDSLCLLARHYVLQNNIPQAVEILAELDAGEHPSTHALCQFAQGNFEAALSNFEMALSLHRKATRKRNYSFTDLEGFFYLCCLIKTRDLKQWETAYKHAKQSQKQWQDNYRSVFVLLEYTIEHLQGKGQREIKDLDYYIEKSQNPVATLTYCLICCWTDTAPYQQKLAELARHAEQAQHYGMTWFSSAALGVLNRLEYTMEDSKEIATDNIFASLVNIIPLQAPWQRTLSLIKNIGATELAQHKDDDDDDDQGSSFRLIWTLAYDSDDDLMLVPREQRRNKSGQWQKGRNVELKRFVEVDDSLPPLSIEDKKIIQVITQKSDWQNYSGNKFHLPTADALFAAIGHHHIYYLHDLSSPVEVIAHNIKLLVESDQDDISISLRPFPKSYETRIATPEGEHRILIYTVQKEHQALANLITKKGLTIPSDARKEVMDAISAVAPLVSVHSDIGGGDEVETVDGDDTLYMQLSPVDQGIKVRALIKPFGKKGPAFAPGQGGRTVFATQNKKPVQAKRDLVQECTLIENLGKLCPSLNGLYDGEGTFPLLEESLEILLTLQSQEGKVVVEWPQGKRFHIGDEIGTDDLKLNIKKTRDWLELDGELIINDEVIAITKLLELLADSPGRFIKISDGKFIALTQDLRQRLSLMEAYADNEDDKLRFHALAASILDDITRDITLKADKHWQQIRDDIVGAENFHPELPSTFNGELRDYQVSGFRWLMRLAKLNLGACLADDMGLGKTIQALATILHRAPDGPTLIIAPTSVCHNWHDEAIKFTPTLRAEIFGQNIAPEDREAQIKNTGPFDVLIASYGLMQNNQDFFTEKQWHTIVIDEAQAIKNRHTKRTKSILALQGDFKVATTGTPIENHLGELWPLFQFINPGLLGNLDKFNTRFVNPIEVDNDNQAKQQLKKLIQPFVLRRLKNDVLRELPPKTEITLSIKMSEEEKIFQEGLRQHALKNIAGIKQSSGKQRIQILAEIMRLRRACCHPQLVVPGSDIASSKLAAFSELVTELRENDHKILVFSQFVGHLTILREWLNDEGISHQYLDGSTPQKKRKVAIDAFQAGGGDVFLISLKAGGAGLNLTAADYVIHMDPWWNPAVEDQASDRAHRIGQTRPVTIYRLIAEDTIEQKILALHHHKRDLADRLLEGSNNSARLDVDELVKLIQAQ